MKAVVWRGQEDVRVENVPDPKLINPRDCILKVTSTAICGSDLHLYGGWMPTMQSGDILGHEFMGEVAEVGKEVKNLKRGDRALVPFCISCGKCWFCQKQLTSLCDNSNPNFRVADKLFGYPTAGLFGYSHLTGGYAGGQAEYVRVPFADTNAFKVDGLSDEQALFLTDIFPTGYMGAENANIERGDVVAVFGCGPVGQFCIKSALLLGAERVIAIDRFPERLQMAKEKAGATEVINYEQADVMDELHVRTGGRGPDAVIDAVGLEAHGTDFASTYDKVKAAARLATDRPNVLRMAILACRKGGTVSVPGVYGGFLDKVPFGAAMNKGLTIKSGQTHVHRYVKPLMERIQKGEIDPTFIITHREPLGRAPEMYKTFRAKQDDCVKVVLRP